MADKMVKDGELKGLGGKQNFLEVKVGKVAPFNDTSGGPINPFGNDLPSAGNAADMAAQRDFLTRNFTNRVDAMGTDYPTKPTGSLGNRNSNDGDHLKVGKVEPMGQDVSNNNGGQIKRG